MHQKSIFPVLTGVLVVFAVCGALSAPVLAITAEEIIARRDDNEYFASAKVEAEMVIVNRGRESKKSMVFWVKGDNALLEFTNAADRGTKFLKHGDELWMFFPDAEEAIRLSGHMLNQGMMGSDFSYRDMMEADKLIESYTFTLKGEEEIAGRPCYVIEGVAREGAEVSYYRRLARVDKERFIGLREELYAPSGRLLKVVTVEEVDQIQGRWYPIVTVMEDKLRRNTRTVLEIAEIDFNVDIPDSTFSLQQLR